MTERHTPERIRELDEVANRTADVVLKRMQPAKRWLAARKAGEGSPADGGEHDRKIGRLLADMAHAVRELEADGLGEISGCKRLTEAVTALRDLSMRLNMQIAADKRSS